ncbi:MAG: hypothetical protein IIB83_04240, partial [Bacteroidetes bacterium]|nr:hypothetical protein [Bacteroidota bacterium]
MKKQFIYSLSIILIIIVSLLFLSGVDKSENLKKNKSDKNRFRELYNDMFTNGGLIIYPTNTSKKIIKKYKDELNNLRLFFRRFKMDIAADSSVSDSLLKNKVLLIIGTPKSNKIFERIKDKLPINISANGFDYAGYKFESPKDIGIFAYKNPFNDKKISFFVIGNNDEYVLENIQLRYLSGIQIKRNGENFIIGEFRIDEKNNWYLDKSKYWDFSKSREIFPFDFGNIISHSNSYNGLSIQSINAELKNKINNLKDYSKEYILNKLDIREGDSITFKSFNKGIERLSATNNFKTINYKFLPEEGGNRIVLNIVESDLKSTFSFGVHYDDLFKTGIILNYQTKGLLLKNDVFSTDLVLGDNIRYTVNYFIDNGFHWNFGVRTRYVRFIDEIKIIGSLFKDDTVEATSEKVRLDYNDFTTQIYAQTTFKQRFIAGLGLEHKYTRAFSEATINDTKIKFFYENENYYNAYLYLKLDTYDAENYPKKGIGLSVTYRAYLASSANPFSTFTQLDGSLSFVTSFNSKLTFQFITDAGTIIGNNLNPALDFHLGGTAQNLINTFKPFYGYDIADLSDSGYLKSTFI